MEEQEVGNYLVVAGIDFGTSFYGYAYSFRHAPHQINMNQKWESGHEGGACVTYKTPTTVLFDNKGNFNSFGYEAEDKYAYLIEKGEAKEWRYFRQFKMNLHQALVADSEVLGNRRVMKVSLGLKLYDQDGNGMEAIRVFTVAIRYLKDHFLRTLKSSTKHVMDSDVLWILTVPAIWGPQAKQFMRVAAENAGIVGKSLRLALEPEAAAIYLKDHEIQKKEGIHESTMVAFQPGEQFMIVDCGGGTVDITVHEVRQDNSLREMCIPSGGPWGGTSVDDRFYDFLRQLFGEKIMEKMQKKYPSTMIDLQRAFETKKRLALKEDGVSLSSGVSQINAIFNKDKKDLKKSIPKSFANLVDFDLERMRMRMSRNLMKRFFQTSLQDISNHMTSLFRNSDLENVDTILLVGGFSESPTLKSKLEEDFPTKHFILPRDASLAILKGAVLCGHCPRSITTRLSSATYGIATDVPFDANIHPEKHLHKKKDGSVCTDVFKVMVARHQPQTIDDTVFEEYFRPPNADDTSADIEVYSSTCENPSYTTDPECQRIGVVTIQIPDTSKGKDRLIKVQMHFGDTELYVTAVEEGTNNKVAAAFDCLK